MNARKAPTFLFFIILISLLLSGCAGAPVTTREIGDRADCRRRLLIASERSEFKDAVVNSVVDAVRAEVCYLKLVDITNLRHESPNAYDAVVILSACKAWKPNPEADLFVERSSAREKIILVSTALGPKCREEPPEVNAITAASRLHHADDLVRTIEEHVRKLQQRVTK
jgi:hypothetical protein